jgi:hypothetical protein
LATPNRNEAQMIDHAKNFAIESTTYDYASPEVSGQMGSAKVLRGSPSG